MQKVNQENQERIEKYLSEDTDNGYLNIDLNSLKQINDDLIGWIYIPGLKNFSYPLVQSHDNHEYLVTSFEGSESEAGVPFIDMNCAADFSDFNTLIYGHYTVDGNLFGALYSYDQEDSYNSYPELQIYTLDHKVRIYSIVAVEEVNINNTQLFTTGYLSDLNKQNYIEEMIGHSKYNYDIDFNTNDSIVNLICCCQSVDQNYRLIVSFKFMNEVELS